MAKKPPLKPRQKKKSPPRRSKQPKTAAPDIQAVAPGRRAMRPIVSDGVADAANIAIQAAHLRMRQRAAIEGTVTTGPLNLTPGMQPGSRIAPPTTLLRVDSAIPAEALGSAQVSTGVTQEGVAHIPLAATVSISSRGSAASQGRATATLINRTPDNYEITPDLRPAFDHARDTIFPLLDSIDETLNQIQPFLTAIGQTTSSAARGIGDNRPLESIEASFGTEDAKIILVADATLRAQLSAERSFVDGRALILACHALKTSAARIVALATGIGVGLSYWQELTMDPVQFQNQLANLQANIETVATALKPVLHLIGIL